MKTKTAIKITDADRAIGLRVRAFRIAAGFSQQQLADLVGVSYQQAFKWERGVNRISSGRLIAIAHALGRSPAEFFDGADKAPDHPRRAMHMMRAFAALPGPAQRAIEAYVRAQAEAWRGLKRAAE